MKIKLILQCVADIRHAVKNGVPHDLIFKPTGGLSAEGKQKLQESLNYHFDLWRTTWILPELEEIERLIKAKKVKS